MVASFVPFPVYKYTCITFSYWLAFLLNCYCSLSLVCEDLSALSGLASLCTQTGQVLEVSVVIFA